nr:hypothetical protein [Tanacetum cinerariifolium]
MVQGREFGNLSLLVLQDYITLCKVSPCGYNSFGLWQKRDLHAQFWYTITQELSTQKFYSTMGDQVIKFANKGSKDLVYGMPIPDVMLNNVIKASVEYSEYLAKFTVSAPAKATGQGKGLLTKDGVELLVTLDVPDVQTLKHINEGAGMSSEVLDEPSDELRCSSSNSELAVEDISTDDDEVTEKADKDVKKGDTISNKYEGVKIADVEKDTDTQVAEEQPAKQQTRDDEHSANIEPVSDPQAGVQMTKP